MEEFRNACVVFKTNKKAQLYHRFPSSHINIVPRYQGYIGAALVLGGVDVTGPHLYSIYPHGSTDKLPYVTMGKCWLLSTLTQLSGKKKKKKRK